MNIFAFHDPLGDSILDLHVGDYQASTGVRHDGCDVLADVSPELDCAFCPHCHWQCRISGAWYVDMLAFVRAGRRP